MLQIQKRTNRPFAKQVSIQPRTRISANTILASLLRLAAKTLAYTSFSRQTICTGAKKITKAKISRSSTAVTCLALMVVSCPPRMNSSKYDPIQRREGRQPQVSIDDADNVEICWICFTVSIMVLCSTRYRRSTWGFGPQST